VQVLVVVRADDAGVEVARWREWERAQSRVVIRAFDSAARSEGRSRDGGRRVGSAVLEAWTRLEQRLLRSGVVAGDPTTATDAALGPRTIGGADAPEVDWILDPHALLDIPPPSAHDGLRTGPRIVRVSLPGFERDWTRAARHAVTVSAPLPFEIATTEADPVGRTLLRGSIAPGRTISETLARMHRRIPPLMLEAVARQQGVSGAGEAPGAPDAQGTDRGAGVRYLRSLGVRAARAAGRRIARRSRIEAWHVAFAPVPWSAFAYANAREVVGPVGYTLADPFVVEHAGTTVVFVEEIDDAGKGRIAAYELADGSARRIGVALEGPHHLSFPFVLVHGGRVFMCPEEATTGRVSLYEATDFPLGWTRRNTLVEGVPAVDPLIVPTETGWLLLVSIDPYGFGAFDGMLAAYASDDLERDHWDPLPANPVSCEAFAARNGGLIREGSRMRRVSQIPVPGYGSGYQVRDVLSAGTGGLVERVIDEVRAEGLGPGINGAHHVHSADGVTVVDVRTVRRG
jgi:hypothetical protein